jgi:hypothetical protein
MITTEKQINKFYETFTATLKDFPEITKIKINYYYENKVICKDEIDIPTEKIFVDGDWIARILPGTPIYKIKQYLKDNNLYKNLYGQIGITILN